MNLIANMPVRNADWVLGLSARAALQWCDSLVLFLHACVDRSAEIARKVAGEYPDRVQVLTEDNPKWLEMDYRQRMLDYSRGLGATHIAIADADEVLTGNVLGSIRGMIESAPAEAVSASPLYNLRSGIEQYHSNGIWGYRRVPVAFQDAPHLHWTGDRWHHREPMGSVAGGHLLMPHGAGGLMHLWGASERRLKAHHAHYKLSERERWPQKSIAEIDGMYSLAVRGGDQWIFAPVPDEWWEPYSPWMGSLDLNAEPWEEAECRKILARSPGIERGLDLFGVVA